MDISLNIITGVALAVAFLLTFTISDYYFFNKFSDLSAVNPAFILSQWVKKAGLLLLPLAVYLKKRGCADVFKYVMPVFVIISCFYGGYFDVTKPDYGSTAQKIYNSINLFMPKGLNMALFFAENALYIAACALLFVRDGACVRARSFIYFGLAFAACAPLNIFENFFDRNLYDIDSPYFRAGSPLLFKSLTIWHALAVLILVGFTVGSYYILKSFGEKKRQEYLIAAAIVLLIQYHSKDSVILGDGYNVYHTIFACVPLFICNIGVYVASLSVFLKKRVLYAISFFVHAAGAITVFVYFGKPELSNYGIFCSYSILYFCLTHCLLFALSVLPSALGMYKFRWKDCVIPLIYYFAVIIIASFSAALVTASSYNFRADGFGLAESEILRPNYAFTQENPLPFEVPPVLTLKITVGGGSYEMNVLYILGLYAVYVGIFFIWTGLYYAFLAVRAKIIEREGRKLASSPWE